MLIVVALGGNALLRRGEPLTADTQRERVRAAARALSGVAEDHTLVVTHGNGPQVGLLALQAEAYRGAPPLPLDVLGAESEGMIGYLVEQELRAALPARAVATLVTQVEVDPDDAAFHAPDKPIGPLYGEAEARRIEAERGWTVAPDGRRGFRRVVPSPAPRRILELGTIELLVAAGVIVVCNGGGGVPVVVGRDGAPRGVEAVIDKDRSAALLAAALGADLLVLLTDVDAVYAGWETPAARPLGATSPAALRALPFAPGSMAPKVEAACRFVEGTGGAAAIGALEDVAAVVRGEAGTQVRPDAAPRAPARPGALPAPEAAGAPGAALRPENPALLSALELFVVATPPHLDRFDLAPFGVPVASDARVDPLRRAAEPLLDLLARLDAVTFGPIGMPMPRWVFFDAAELPGGIVGLACRAGAAPPSLREVLGAPAGYEGLLPLSMYIAIPAVERGVWIGHNLASLRAHVPDLPLRGLARVTKALALKVFRAEAQIGATQWASRATGVHARMGPLALLSAWTPAHADPASLTYRARVDDAVLRSLAGDPGGHVARPAPEGWIDSGDTGAIQALQARIEAGERLCVAGAPEAIAPGRQRVPIARSPRWP